MTMKTEDHEGIQIPVGEKAPSSSPTITPTKGGWPGTPAKGENGNGGNGGKKK
jgi:hypothetical protein